MINEEKNEDDLRKINLEGLKFPYKLIIPAYIIEYITFLFAFTLRFESFSKEPNCVFCNNCSSDPGDLQEKNNKFEEKKIIKEKIKQCENNIKKCDLKKKEMDTLLEKIIYEERMLKVNKEKIIYKLHIKRTITIQLEDYYKINERIDELKNKLVERKNELERVKNDYNKRIFKEINSLLNGKKFKINCFYFDESINADDDFCSGYNFFKILKNSIDGIFFGIKSEQDFYYLNTQLPQDPKELKLVLVYSINDKKKAEEFLESYHSKFSDIIIFTIDPKEFSDMENKFKNIISIESDYDSLLSKLIQLKNSDYKDFDKYKPYDLNLYSDYLNNKLIQECHLELLNNTELSKYRNEQDFEKGLSQQEYLNFLTFLDENLDDETSTKKEKEIENKQFIVRDEDEDDRQNHIQIRIKLKDNYKRRRDNDNDIDLDFKSNRRIQESAFNMNIEDNVPNVYPNNREKLRNFNNGRENDDRKLNENIDILIKERPHQKKEIIGKENKSDKSMIKSNLENRFQKAKGLLQLYTLERGKFYKKLNDWLRIFNLDIYKKISPISGKIINFLYLIMKSNKNTKPKKLYRGLDIKKADIFLYKACEGDIFFYPAFTSTTIDSKITDVFKNEYSIDLKKLDEKCNCLIEINYNLENGDVLQEADISNYSEHKMEVERLFPPYSFFKIKRVLFNDGKNVDKENIFDGTFEHPFKIELELIKRNFYLDEAIVKNKSFNFNKKAIRWELK